MQETAPIHFTGVWVVNNFDRLVTQAERRNTTVERLLVHMLDNSLYVYEDESETQVTEFKLAEQEGIAQHRRP